MFCKECGKETNNGTNICDNCSTSFIDKGGFKYGLLGFLFPIAGIVIYYMLKDKEPNLCYSFKIGTIVMICMSVTLIGATILTEILGVM